MSNHIRLRRGLNIPLKGSALSQITKTISSDILAMKPADFRLLNPKLLVKEGDSVKAGTPVMSDKKRPEIVFCSPTSGTISQFIRGEKRKLLEIRIQSDKKNEFLPITTPNFRSATRKELIDTLVSGGLWPTIIQRPYGIIPNPEVEPKSIFISGFDSSPLAPNLDFALKKEMEHIQIGVDILNMLAKGGVHISLHASNYASTPFHKLEKVIIHTFDGPHPVGNVGVQIHHINPINKGEVVWTIDLYSVAAIGKLFAKGIYDVKKIIAITGPRVNKPSYVECLPGMCMTDIKEYAGNPGCKRGESLPIRYVSGNILTGDNVGAYGFLGFYHHQITLLSEGSYNEMFGWAKPFRLKKFSFSHSYFSWLFPSKEYSMDTNLNGGERAFVMTGIYEKVLPMNIYPMFLLKAILAEDIDRMEALGIYEVIEEDLALCEYVCPSKIEIQEIVSKGIDLMIKEMS
ncbi:MAG: Na(+)-translocating NADH-quinone reductase subunit A [Bacteroidales bacterium]